MGAASRKGYEGEVGAVQLLAPLGLALARPRTTSHAHTDTGDVHGLPLVVSVKNHAAMRLPAWMDELAAMVDRSTYDTGVVVVKRRGKGRPEDWYVITTGGLAVPILFGYLDWLQRQRPEV